MRIFVAINFSEEFKGNIINVQNKLKALSCAGNFTREENLHLTLAFIGEVGSAKPIINALGKIDFESFEIYPSRLGRFGDSLYYIGVSGGEKLNSLANSVRSELAGAGISFDSKPFKPHITLVREMKGFAGDFKDICIPSGKMTVSSFDIMKSERINGKLIYTNIFNKKSK